MTEFTLMLWSLMLGLIAGILLTHWAFGEKLREAADNGRRLEWDGALYNITEDES